MEVEEIEYPDNFTNVVIGRVLSCEKIAGSRNHQCEVNIGGRTLQIICGAPNVRKGLTVPVVMPEGVLPSGRKIGLSEIDGFRSEGMICSQFELGLGGEADVIWELPEISETGRRFEIGSDFRGYFPSDTVFKLEVTINRPDCLSHIGVAREIAAALGVKLNYPDIKMTETEKECSDALEVIIEDAEKCPRYCGRIMKGIEIKPSPGWMQRRLMAVGMRPISNVVDVTNYVMLEYGHPLHAFDLNFIKGGKIIVKTAQDGERFTTLDEKEHILSSDDLLICDGERGVALAGVMGGLNSEISESTQDILLECAYFQPASTHFTAGKLGIDSESAHRFERGVDPNDVPQVIDRTAQLIQMTGGGKIYEGRVDAYPQKIHPVEITLRNDRIEWILGYKIEIEKSADLLKSIELGVEKISDDELKVTAPTFRPDLKQEIDLIEETARLNGYDKVQPATRSLVSLKVEPLPDEDFDNVLRNALTAQGFTEMLTHSMRPRASYGLLENKPVEIENPISADFAVLRTDLIAPLLDSAAYNFNRGIESVRAFEIGSVFRIDSDGGICETRQIAGLISGRAQPIFWGENPRNCDFYDIKGAVNNLFKRIYLDNLSIYSYLKNTAGFENFLEYKMDEETFGGAGEIAKNILEKYGVEQAVFVFYLDYKSLQKRYNCRPVFKRFSKFPAVKRDISVVFDESVPAAEIIRIIEERGGGILVNQEIFDIFRGEQIGAGKKSLAFSLKFQAEDRTLTDEEVDRVQDNLIAALEKRGGKLRFIQK